MTADVFGYYGSNNAGDDAFALVFSEIFGGDVRFHRGRSADGGPIPRLILGGGAVVSRYFFDRMPCFDRLHVVGCSVPYHDEGIALLEAARDRLGLCVLRSAADVAAMTEAGIAAELLPDLVFALARPAPTLSVADVRALAALPTVAGIADRSLAIFLSDHYTSRAAGDEPRRLAIETYKRQLAAAFDALSARFNLLLVPMSVWYGARDAAFAHDVAARMKRPEKATIIEAYLGPAKILEIVSSVADVVLSMKYHGLVFGMLCGKPVVNIADSSKNIDLMRDSDLGAFDLRIEGTTTEALIDAVARAPASADRIAGIAAANRRALEPLRGRLRASIGA